ncbi:hypothetical protein H4S02_006593, partial [Coemansia sp. RSA 2611]
MRAIHSSTTAPQRNRKSDDDTPVGFENFLNKPPKKDDSAKTSSKPETQAKETPGKSAEGDKNVEENKSEEADKGPEPDNNKGGNKGSTGGLKGSKKDNKSDSSSSTPSASDVLSWAIYGLVGYEVYNLMQPEKNQ